MKAEIVKVFVLSIWNLKKSLNVDLIQINPNGGEFRERSRDFLINEGNCFLAWIEAIYEEVPKVAHEKGIPIVFYGENGELEYGGSSLITSFNM